MREREDDAEQVLNERLLEGLGIPTLGPARHLIRRGEGAEEREFFPDRCWAITAMPSFHNWGLFAVFESRSLVRCAFVCKGDVPDNSAIDDAVVDCLLQIPEWSDPVMDLLTGGPLAPVPDRSMPEDWASYSLDGIAYVLRVESRDISATLRFSNPRGRHYRSLERAACDLARRMARLIEHPQVSSFVETWRSYVGDD